AQVIGYSKKMDVYYPRLGVFVFSLKSRKNKTENSDIIYATVVITIVVMLCIRFQNIKWKVVLENECRTKRKTYTIASSL
ncbi:hypothetical protein, partial [Anoxybacillus flavithermus]|uniref:hypothetical protein n=1 Tax=Anoxybacillus flavithermus TaxID=33934 RepID=UPI0019D69BCA